MRNTNEMMAGSLPSTQPRPIPFHLDKSATESKQSPPVSRRREDEGREDGQREDRRTDRGGQAANPEPRKKEVSAQLNQQDRHAALC